MTNPNKEGMYNCKVSVCYVYIAPDIYTCSYTTEKIYFNGVAWEFESKPDARTVKTIIDWEENEVVHIRPAL